MTQGERWNDERRRMPSRVYLAMLPVAAATGVFGWRGALTNLALAAAALELWMRSNPGSRTPRPEAPPLLALPGQAAPAPALRADGLLPADKGLPAVLDQDLYARLGLIELVSLVVTIVGGGAAELTGSAAADALLVAAAAHGNLAAVCGLGFAASWVLRRARVRR